MRALHAPDITPDNLPDLQVVLDAIPIPVFLRDQRYTYIACNRAFESLLGRCRTELVGRSAFAVGPRWPDRRPHAHGRDALACSTSDAFEIAMVDGQGIRRDVVFTEEAVAGAAGMIAATILDITGCKRAEEELSYQATHDALTGLPNRAHFAGQLEAAVASCEAGSDSFAVVFVDLDRFKAINDTLGHGAGDELLRQVGARLRQSIREEDALARLGGDEFTLVFPGCGEAEAAARAASRILDGLVAPFEIAGKRLVVGASVGLSRYPSDGRDPETLLRRADTALYRAKQAGRNRYRLFDMAMDDPASEKEALEAELGRALAAEELHLALQPQVDLVSGKEVGFEVLLRWTHQRLGAISPGRFIPVAEESGLIVPLGAWVLEQACKLAVHRLASEVAAVPLAVNVSARQLEDDAFPETVGRILRETGLPPALLELEITESALMEDVGRVVGTLGKLRALGVRLALDDFGTGYSSLSRLRELPLDRLKIDGSFVRAVQEGATAEALVRGIVEMGRALGLRVLAECVETEEEAALLRALGCEEAQGYLYGRPAPVARPSR